MAYTEVTSKNWFQRLGESFTGIIAGIIIICAGTWLLWWNEERTFKTAGAIGEAEILAQEINNVSTLDSSLNGQVIHATGRAETQEILRDPIFKISVNAIKLQRDVEFYQWEEHEESETRKKLGGGEETITTYTYNKKWTSEPVDSQNFRDPSYKNSNKIIAKVEDADIWAKDVNFGAYKLPDFLIHSIGGEISFNITSFDARAAQNLLLVQGNKRGLIHASGNTIYLGSNPANPEIGDVRISFKQILPADISIIAQISGNTFSQYKATNGYTFSRLEMGRVSMSDMFEHARTSNKIMSWILRLVGTLAIIMSLSIIFRPLSVAGDLIPFIGSIIGALTGFAAFLLGLAWSLIVIAVAWVRFRPLISGILIAIALGLIILSFMKSRKSESGGN